MNMSGTNQEFILCVDDEAIILMSLKFELKSRYGSRFGYETALNAEEALDIIDSLYRSGARIILLLSDWLMPGMKGDEFVLAVHKKFPDIRSVIISGHSDEFSIQRAKNEGNLIACLKKPWNSHDLFSIIDDILQPQA